MGMCFKCSKPTADSANYCTACFKKDYPNAVYGKISAKLTYPADFMMNIPPYDPSVPHELGCKPTAIPPRPFIEPAESNGGIATLVIGVDEDNG